MKRTELASAKNIIRHLVDKYRFNDLLSSLRERTTAGHLRPAGKPGDVILNLPAEQREALQQLKPEDMANDRAWHVDLSWAYKLQEEDRKVAKK